MFDSGPNSGTGHLGLGHWKDGMCCPVFRYSSIHLPPSIIYQHHPMSTRLINSSSPWTLAIIGISIVTRSSNPGLVGMQPEVVLNANPKECSNQTCHSRTEKNAFNIFPNHLNLGPCFYFTTLQNSWKKRSGFLKDSLTELFFNEILVTWKSKEIHPNQWLGLHQKRLHHNHHENIFSQARRKKHVSNLELVR